MVIYPFTVPLFHPHLQIKWVKEQDQVLSPVIFQLDVFELSIHNGCTTEIWRDMLNPHIVEIWGWKLKKISRLFTEQFLESDNMNYTQG